MIKIGRNDPCPCGSGKKYKHCCAGKDSAPMTQAKAELQALIEAQGGFADLEEAQVFMGQWQQSRNTTGLDDFQGLSPDQMSRFLQAPFDASGLIDFHAEVVLTEVDKAPLMQLFTLLSEALGEAGLKPTATGNLPRNLCRKIAQAYWGDAGYAEATRFGGINSEPDFPDLHKTRVVAELAGLIRKYKGRYILSSIAKKARDNAGWSSLYPLLFRTYCESFNWGYEDRFPEFHIIQQSFAFSLLLLSRWGDKPLMTSSYEDAFLRAFPVVLDEAEDREYHSAEEQVRNAYRLRCLERGWVFLGLASDEEAGKGEFGRTLYRIRKTGLLDRWVRFGV